MPLAEHRLYGPLLGVLLVAAALLGHRRRAHAAASAPLRRVAFGALLVVGVALAASRSLDFRDERQLWRAELAQRPLSWRAWWGLGTASLRAGDAEGAIEPLGKAHLLAPLQFDVLRNYAEALIQVPEASAQPFRALAVAGQLVQRSPRDPWARTLFAEAHLQAGRATGDAAWFREAEALALSCLQIAEPKGLVYRMAAAARRGAGDPAGALLHLDTALARGFDLAGVRLDRAELLRELGQPRRAHQELLRAQQLAPADAAVQRALWASAQPPR